MPAPTPRKLLSTQNPKSIVGSWLFTIVWCGISFTVFWAFAFGSRQTSGAIIGGLFSLLGLVMLYASIQMTLEYFKFGRVDIRLEGEPVTGGSFGARLDVPGDVAGTMTIHAELVCVQATWSRGSKGGPSRSERDVWSRKNVFPLRQSGVGGYATMKFDVPVDQPASDLPEELAPDAMAEVGHPAGIEIDRSYYRWELRVKADMPGIDLDRTYQIRVVRGSGMPDARPSIAAAPLRVNPVVKMSPENRFGGTTGLLITTGVICFIGFQAWPFIKAFKSDRPAAAPVQQQRSAVRSGGASSGTTTSVSKGAESNEEQLKNTLASIDGEGGSETPAAGLAHYQLSQVYERQKKTAAQEQELLRALTILEGPPAAEVRKALGPDGAWLDKEVVARRLGDFYWDQRNYPKAYAHYDRAYRHVSDIEVSDFERNRRLARNSAGRMVGACTQSDWAVADQAMQELKERIVSVDDETRKQLEYWIRTGEPRLAARKC